MESTPYSLTVALLRSMGPCTLRQIATELVTQCSWIRDEKQAAFEARDSVAYGIKDGSIEEWNGSYDAVFPRAMEIGRSESRIYDAGIGV